MGPSSSRVWLGVTCPRPSSLTRSRVSSPASRTTENCGWATDFIHCLRGEDPSPRRSPDHTRLYCGRGCNRRNSRGAMSRMQDCICSRGPHRGRTAWSFHALAGPAQRACAELERRQQVNVGTSACVRSQESGPLRGTKQPGSNTSPRCLVNAASSLATASRSSPHTTSHGVCT